MNLSRLGLSAAWGSCGRDLVQEAKLPQSLRSGVLVGSSSVGG